MASKMQSQAIWLENLPSFPICYHFNCQVSRDKSHADQLGDVFLIIWVRALGL